MPDKSTLTLLPVIAALMMAGIAIAGCDNPKVGSAEAIQSVKEKCQQKSDEREFASLPWLVRWQHGKWVVSVKARNQRGGLSGIVDGATGDLLECRNRSGVF